MKPIDPNKQLYRDMQEAPDKYSDQELEAMMDEIDLVPDVDEAWRRFARQHIPPVRPIHAWRKVAALLIGILTMSGIAIAAINIVRQSRLPQPQKETAAVAADASRSAHGPQSARQDSLSQPRLYDNVPLGEILSALSAYYHVEVEYRTEDAPRLRLFYRWKPEYSLEKVIEMLNNFEWLQLELAKDTLYVSAAANPAHDS